MEVYLRVAVRQGRTQAAQQIRDVSSSTARPGEGETEHDMGVLD
jgi:hypothetical protein